MIQISKEISRQIGVVINRRGIVENVVIGDKERIKIPGLATNRAGRKRFRGLRFIHTHLEGELLSREDLTDLSILQLDLIASIFKRKGESTEMIHIGHLMPEGSKGKAWEFIGPLYIHELEIDFTGLINELENEFTKKRGDLYSLDKDREKTILVCVVLPGRYKDIEENVAEITDLCYSAGITVLDIIIQKPKELHPKYLIGKGKLEEIILKCRQQGADLLVFDEGLTSGQIKNISAITELKVIDRNQLILDIFAQRANTNESKIQVELAQLNYILPRLADKNTALSRLTGGIGTRGPGETKLEVNKSRIRSRISFLEKKLEEIRQIRKKKRQKRKSSGIPIVSIIGYTNSGKSTLLNLLTKSKVETEDKSFSTLNPTTRLIKYPERKNIIITDTVGFIKDLPEVLLKAFIATLEELEDADILLHLVDISSTDFEEKMDVVKKIIKLLDLSEKKILTVLNKTDKIDKTFLDRIEDRYQAISISCIKKEGMERLIQKIEIELPEEQFKDGFPART